MDDKRRFSMEEWRRPEPGGFKRRQPPAGLFDLGTEHDSCGECQRYDESDALALISSSRPLSLADVKPRPVPSSQISLLFPLGIIGILMSLIFPSSPVAPVLFVLSSASVVEALAIRFLGRGRGRAAWSWLKESATAARRVFVGSRGRGRVVSVQPVPVEIVETPAITPERRETHDAWADIVARADAASLRDQDAVRRAEISYPPAPKPWPTSPTSDR